MKKRVTIIGGGASGMLASIVAARNGANVTIVEQKDRIGKKILSTGNGRCNLTNEKMNDSFYHGKNISIVTEALNRFGYKDTIQFFKELGLLTKNKCGYIYPLTEQAVTVLDVLTLEIERLKINILFDTKVLHITKNKKEFQLSTNRQSLRADSVIIATGGKAASILGSDGSGYSLARELGHTLVPIVPALVQLIGKGNYFKRISGIRTEASVAAFVDQQMVAKDIGEIQLTNYGISGIPVFQISRFIAMGLYQKCKVSVKVDFLPSLNAMQCETYFKERRDMFQKDTAERLLIGIFHKKLISLFLDCLRIKKSTPIISITDQKVRQLAQLCKEFEIEIEGTNPFEQAQICAGGVSTDEIRGCTMESKYVDSLYFTGEILDVDGICGGYNLQWAWTTGYLAGQHASNIKG